ncbi:MAG: LysM peptidoglycan-binding domain-containing M23 family metallopeptidase [Anaerolineaceae bacterium]|nr:LysM peptidoglycan-binding domain-containing M23 family metallopeptidase [Anaerolineaceae bacterium]
MKFKLILVLALLLGSTAACFQSQPQVVVITATFEPTRDAAVAVTSVGEGIPAALSLSPVPGDVFITPTPDPTRPVSDLPVSGEYIVQPGDTLSGIAAANGVTLDALLALNALDNPNILSVGQVVKLPAPPDTYTPDLKLLPDSKFVRGPGSGNFDVAGFIAQQPGYIRTATDTIDNLLYPAAAVVRRVSLEYSVDPRLLLALLEYKAGWLSQAELSDTAQDYSLEGQESPLGFDRRGLYKQLAWAANQLNSGYYGWKYGDLRIVEFDLGIRQLYATGLNAGTVGLQYFLSLNNTYSNWQVQVSREGFYYTYYAYFGDPFVGSIEPLAPPNIPQPEMVFPFSVGETWFFTGGPHGGWGSGSAWAALDFAPPDEIEPGSPGCYVSEYWATAVAPGIIARSGGGSVILDLDGDGDETTGWTVLYLHMATEGRVQAGTVVQAGDSIGHPSCEGGFSNATHMHIARRYNGEWIPVFCDSCAPEHARVPFVMSGWTSVGLPGQEYQGYMVQGDERRVAEQGRLTTENQVSR